MNSSISNIDYSKIDKSLICIIKILNKKGFKTYGCCSGIYRDHDEECYFDKKFNRGYISFSPFLSDKNKEILINISLKCCLKFVNNYNSPIYRFEAGVKECVLLENFNSPCMIQNFVPIINFKPEDKDNINITLDTLPKDISDIVINDRWKKLHEEIKRLAVYK